MLFNYGVEYVDSERTTTSQQLSDDRIRTGKESIMEGDSGEVLRPSSVQCLNASKTKDDNKRYGTIGTHTEEGKLGSVHVVRHEYVDNIIEF